MENDDEKSLVASLLFDVPVLDDPFKVAREGIRRLQGPRARPADTPNRTCISQGPIGL